MQTAFLVLIIWAPAIGGGPDTAALLISYFADQRTHVNDTWDRSTGITKEQSTQEMLNGKRCGGQKPVAGADVGMIADIAGARTTPLPWPRRGCSISAT